MSELLADGRIQRYPATAAATITVAGLCERDIDLLLLEELHSSPSFQSWFLERVSGDAVTNGRFVEAGYSVRQTLGESDLEVWFCDDLDHRTCVLLENKINAAPQPQQASRYKQRADAYLQQERAFSAYTAIVAPKTYLSGRSARGFDANLSYEELGEWFANAENLGTRRFYKLRLLMLGIEKGRIGYLLREDRAVSEFWHEYYECATEKVPELQMSRPRPKAAGSGFIYFRPYGLRLGVRLVHKLADGFLDIQFERMGERLVELRRCYGAILPAEARIERAHKSGVIRVDVPKLNVNFAFQPQKDLVFSCFVSASKLVCWFLNVSPEQPLTL